MPARRRPPRPPTCCAVPRDPGAWPVPRRERLLGLLRALADPTRLEILRLVAAQAEPICACDVVARFDLRQPTISHHLRVLADAGLVTPSRHGVWMHYAIDPRGADVLGDLAALLAPPRPRGAPREA